MTPDFDWPLFLRQLDAIERSWNSRRITYPRADAVPFMPYPLQLFPGLLMDAIAALPGWACYDRHGKPVRPSFLDVGCGPGTKAMLAWAMFGLEAHGIDIVPEFVAAARHGGVDADVADAFTYERYHQHSIVLVNRPSGLQDDLENLVMERMHPGAILIALNWRNNPERNGWQAISQEWGEPVRGVWAKPPGLVHLVGQGITGPTGCCGRLPVGLPPGDSCTYDRPLVTCMAGQGPDDGGFLGESAAAEVDLRDA